MKTVIIRFLNGFCYSVAITVIVQLIVMPVSGDGIMLPEYMERFDNVVHAYAVQLMLVGMISGVASAGTIILEWKRPGLLIQSILYLVLMLGTWIPVSCYLWGFHKYRQSFAACLLSLLVTYGICWVIQYKICIRDVKEINRRLKGNQEV